MSHRVFEYNLHTSVSPERVIEAATDFTQDRLRLWPTISAKQFKVFDLGDTSCDCREGTGPFWERNRWEWSEPGVVKGTVSDSNVHRSPGTWVMRVTPRPEGGSYIDVHMERTFRGPGGLLLQTMIGVGGGSKFFQKSFQKTLNILEQEPVTQPV